MAATPKPFGPSLPPYTPNETGKADSTALRQAYECETRQVLEQQFRHMDKIASADWGVPVLPGVTSITSAQWMEPHFHRRRVLPYPSRSRLHGSENRLNFAAKRLWWVRVYGRQEESGQAPRYGFLYVDGMTGKAEAL